MSRVYWQLGQLVLCILLISCSSQRYYTKMDADNYYPFFVCWAAVLSWVLSWKLAASSAWHTWAPLMFRRRKTTPGKTSCSKNSNVAEMVRNRPIYISCMRSADRHRVTVRIDPQIGSRNKTSSTSRIGPQNPVVKIDVIFPVKGVANWESNSRIVWTFLLWNHFPCCQA